MAALLLAAVVIGISHLTGYGATAAVSLGAPGLVSVEGCGLFTYVHTVRENEMTHRHNLPASYCMTLGLLMVGGGQ